MDNLYNSQKLYSALYLAKCLGHGVARATGRGIPDGIKQPIEPNAKKAEALKGKTTAARLLHCKDCPDLLAVCVYDNKPVHLLSMVSESVEWLVKKRKVYHRESNSMKMMGYLRLNVIDEYNNNMNNVDIADQLRGQYRPDFWMRHKKWWWAVFIWGLGVAGVNGYKIYVAMWDEEKEKGREDLPAKWTHAEFIEQLVYDLIFPAQTLAHREFLRENDDESSNRSLSSFGGSSLQEDNDREWDLSDSTGIKTFLEEKASTKITKRNLLEGSVHARRLDGHFHCLVKALYSMQCQYCYYVFTNEYDEMQQQANEYQRQNKQNTVRCLTCNVNLCPNCWNEWHGVDMRDTNRLLGR
jgi:hypothetical protein